MGVKFGTSWGLAQNFFKNTLLEMVFKKMVSNLSILRPKLAFFYRDRNRVLSDPRYRPPTPVLVMK